MGAFTRTRSSFCRRRSRAGERATGLPVSQRFRFPSVRLAAVQLFRLAVLVAIGWVVRSHAVRLRIGGDAPITLQEVAAIYPEAAALIPDAGERRGLWVHDAAGRELGYVVRTMP